MTGNGIYPDPMSINKVKDCMSPLLSSSAFGDTNRLVLKPESVLGAFLKFRKATISFVMSVCLSVCLSVCQSIRPLGTTQLPLDRFP